MNDRVKADNIFIFPIEDQLHEKTEANLLQTI